MTTTKPSMAEVHAWVLKLYSTCEKTITEAERLEQRTSCDLRSKFLSQGERRAF